MENEQLLQQIEFVKRNPKLSKAIAIFDDTQKIYEKAINAITAHKRPIQKGSYSSSISKKDYYANISTTTQ